MSEKLLKCPFCGSNQLTTEGTKSLRYVYCRECAARGPVWGNNDKAQIAWNTQDRKERDEWMERALAAAALNDCTECYRLAALARQRQDEAWQLNVKCQLLQTEIDKLREAAAETEALLHRGSEPLDSEREPLPFVAVGQTWCNTKTRDKYVVINVDALCKFGDEWVETVSYSKCVDGRVFSRRITDFYANFEPVEVGQ